ncbi:MAG: zf-HC2 domain-containing protein [Pyrinomonadaceae bacterium]|nr:zf-HC2 domain-containing protein [Pyrinomonadaceae bacterium]
MPHHDHICEPEHIAAYIEGDLESSARIALEEHIQQCDRCVLELQEQRRFMCELDSAFRNPFELAVPTNFAQVVAVHAASDMRGVRNTAEHKRALQFCILLGLAAFILLGAAASKAEIAGAASVVNKAAGVFGLIARTIYEIGDGAASMARLLSRSLITASPITGLVGVVFIAVAIGLLSLLIVRYHRTRVVD